MYPPVVFNNMKFGIRELPAFVGHSFAEKDREVVDQLVQVLTKLGLRCESGVRPEAAAVSEKVKERIISADIFVGVFTRRDKIRDNAYSTSPWVVEEKALAIASGKSLLLFVEEGVTEIGGMHGDYEYIEFDRRNIGPAIIRTMDYVLSLTSIPITATVEGAGKVSLKIGSEKTPAQQIDELKKYVAAHQSNVQARKGLAQLLQKYGKTAEAEVEWRALVTDFPRDSAIRHECAHFFESQENFTAALDEFQRALDLKSGDYKNSRCYGRCLYSHAMSIGNLVIRQSSLNKAKRILQRAATIGGAEKRSEIEGDLFIVNEALSECGGRTAGNDHAT